MSDTTIDPLTAAAGGLDEPSFPTLREGVKRMVIRGVEKKSGETNGKPWESATIRLATTEDDRYTEGHVANKGAGFNESIFLVPNEWNSLQKIAEQCAMPVKAALGIKEASRVENGVGVYSLKVWKENIDFINNALKDKIVTVKVGTFKNKKNGQVSNCVDKWIVEKPAS